MNEAQKIKVTYQEFQAIERELCSLVYDQSIAGILSSRHDIALTPERSSWLFRKLYNDLCMDCIEEALEREARRHAKKREALASALHQASSLLEEALTENLAPFRRRSKDDRLAATLLIEQLNDISSRLNGMRNSSRVRKPGRRIKDRTGVWHFFAEIYAEAGGKVTASFKPSVGKIDSPFIGFCRSVLGFCPQKLQDFYCPRLGESIRDWRRQGAQNGKDLRQGIYAKFPKAIDALFSNGKTNDNPSASQAQEMPWNRNTQSKRKLPIA